MEKVGDKIESGERSQQHSEGLYLKQRSTLPAWRPPKVRQPRGQFGWSVLDQARELTIIFLGFIIAYNF